MYNISILRSRKIGEIYFRPERSWFETSGCHLCPATDRVEDPRVVLSSRADMNRTDLRYA